MRSSVLALIVVLSLCSAVHATDRYANPSNLYSQVSAARPGDRVILAPGTYGHLALGKHGSPGYMIQIVAEDPNNRPVVLNPGLEGWKITNCSYFLFDGIVMQGAEEEGFHLQPYGPANTNHIIMRNCDVTMQSTSGNTDCWKSDQTYDTLFYNCRASTSGDCGFDFVGAHDTLIMRSYMTNTGNGGFHAKNGAYNFGFYRNVHDNAGQHNLEFGGHSGLAMHSTDEVAMGNVLIGSPYGVAYTTVRDCDFAYNTVVNPSSAVMRFVNMNSLGGVTTAYNSFTNNLVQYTSSTCVSGPDTEPWTTTFADNFWSKTPSLPAPETGTVVGNPNLGAEYRPFNPDAKDYGAHAPGMEEAWDAYRAANGNPFAWAWSYAVDYDPDAEAGGAYTVYKHGSLGGSVQLDGTGSYAGNNPNADLPNYHQNVISAYGWDLRGDNVFGDATGPMPTVTYADLVGYGRGAAGTYQIELAITVDTDYDDMKDWDTAQLIVAEAPNGDANFDGCADGLDYVVWSSNYKQSGNWGDADFNGDASVDGLDYVIWSNNYLQGCPASPGAVPEPATLSLLALGGLALIRRRK